MGIKKYNPTTPGLRGMTVSTFEEITASKPEKSLLAPAKKHAGRNAQGCITVRHHGGGHKRQYRVIDFKRNKDNIPARVATIEYDPNRSARIALLNYVDGEKRYIIAPNGSSLTLSAKSCLKIDPSPQYIIILLACLNISFIMIALLALLSFHCNSEVLLEAASSTLILYSFSVI